MRTLTAEEARSRAARDGEGVQAINESGYPVHISGFHSTKDAEQERNEVPLVGHYDPPTVFRMRCDFDTLRSPGVPLRGATFVIDSNAGGDYPGTEPLSKIVSRPVPFVPHIGTSGGVCHGHFVWVPWRTQLPDYLAQLCRLLNYDEPPPAGGFTAMNPAAVRHWATLGHRPLDPALGSPIITLDALGARKVIRRSERTPRRGALRRAGEGADAAPRRSLRKVDA